MYPQLNLSMASGLPGRLLMFLQLQLIKLACCSTWYTKAFWLGLARWCFQKLKSYQIFRTTYFLTFTFSFFSTSFFVVIDDATFLLQFPINAGVPQGPILGSSFLLLVIYFLLDDGISNTNCFLHDAISNITIHGHNATPYSKCDHDSSRNF